MATKDVIKVMFIPFLGRSRTLSMVGAACLLAERSGFRCSVVTTQGNSSYIRDTIEEATNVDLQLVPFPAAEAGIPAGIECTDSIPAGFDRRLFRQAMQLLTHPIEPLLADVDVMVCDVLLYWFADLAVAHSVPFFVFDTMSPFSTALFTTIFSSADDQLVGPFKGLPHQLQFFKSELPAGSPFPGDKLAQAAARSHGTIFNSFEELTPEYVDYCRAKLHRFWCVGPLQLKQPPQDHAGIKKWLDSKPPESVVYVSFGSESYFTPEQLTEIAIGLQSCEHSFIWVVRGKGGGAESLDEWLPSEFRSSVGERGLVVTEWAPQFAILNHPATGAFITHCGWRSTLEAVCAGLPVIPWPLHSEQFINERLLVEILRVGVRILEGPKMRSLEMKGKGLVKGSLIKNAVDRLLGGIDEEAIAMRRNAGKYKELARSAMAEGGSSYVNLNHVIEQMKMLAEKKQTK